jgi:hypothetical protein
MVLISPEKTNYLTFGVSFAGTRIGASINLTVARNQGQPLKPSAHLKDINERYSTL